jgi:arginase
MSVALIGIPQNVGADTLEVSLGPDAIRNHHIIEKLGSVGLTVTDYGNIFCKPREKLTPGNPTLKYLDEILRISTESAKLVHKRIVKNEKLVVLGGDHATCLGVVSGASVAVSGDIGLLYIDAHADMNTDKTTPTGNIHGMHVASLMGFGNQDLVHVYKPEIKIKPKNFLLVGGNDLDDGEIALIKNEQISLFKTFDMLTHSFYPLWEKISQLQRQVKHVWISLDFDAIDYQYAPGAGMQNASGFTYREISAIAEYIGQTCNVLGVDVVEYNPTHDIDHKTAELGIELIAKFLGKKYSWYTHYLDTHKLA